MHDAVIGNLYNEMMCLAEIRGELSPEDNARVEERILQIQNEIRELERGFA